MAAAAADAPAVAAGSDAGPVRVSAKVLVGNQVHTLAVLIAPAARVSELARMAASKLAKKLKLEVRVRPG